ncbi:MAG: hypothetical protein IKO92_04905 [Clostridia bacterium]|nr:hypothetical protein [Clostridia bacterium]MBR4662053.1 hypothetical protein [Clostridia bacterium]MBR6915209.1 hypothetical protein [Clostridia bacterium]
MTFLLFAAGYLAISAVLYAIMRAKCRRDPVFRAPRKRWVFYALSLSWGLPAVLIGAVGALFVRLRGNRTVRHGWFRGFSLPGIDWGLWLGLFFIAPEGSDRLRAHEMGHGIQNIWLGIFMPTVVLIPSFFRFRYRRLLERRGRPPGTEYDSVWFEGSATASGLYLLESRERREPSRLAR